MLSMIRQDGKRLFCSELFACKTRSRSSSAFNLIALGFPISFEFKKQPFPQFCHSIEIRFVAATANHHEGNVIVEIANRTIREDVACLALAKPRMAVVDLIATTTFHKNTSLGHRKASSYELLYDRTPRISTIFNPVHHSAPKNNIATTSRRQIQA